MADRWWDGARWRDGDDRHAPDAAPRAFFDAAGHPVMVLPGALRVARLAAATQGVFGILLGAATLLRWRAEGAADGDALLVVGAVQISFSLAVIGAGALLGRLSEQSRVALTCLEVVNAAAVLSQVLTPAALLSLLLDALVVGALWTSSASDAMAAAQAPIDTHQGPMLPRILESPPRRRVHVARLLRSSGSGAG